MDGIVSLLDSKHNQFIEQLFEDSTEIIRQQREERTRQLMGEDEE
jgi:hypothetical protein